MPRWLPELNERDRDLYESEKAYEAWLERRWPKPDLEPIEGYESALDDFGERAEDRQRLIEGTP